MRSEVAKILYLLALHSLAQINILFIAFTVDKQYLIFIKTAPQGHLAFQGDGTGDTANPEPMWV